MCTGNICRSPTAEVIFRAQVRAAGLSDRFTCSSAGLGDWHVGEPADHRALAAMQACGYDGSTHRAAQWQAEHWDAVDVVVALDAGHLDALRAQAPPGREVLLLRDCDPAVAGRGLDVPDPYYGGDQGFAHVLAMIESASAGLLSRLRERLHG